MRVLSRQLSIDSSITLQEMLFGVAVYCWWQDHTEEFAPLEAPTPQSDHTCGNLVAQTSAATVDHHAHLPFVVDAHLPGSIFVVDVIHNLDLGVMISCSQGPQLPITTHWSDSASKATSGCKGENYGNMGKRANWTLGALTALLKHNITWGRPLFFALEETLLGSACSILPYSSQCSLSSAQA